jgi:RimJ/RimL family protein N-acetyltransferase
MDAAAPEPRIATARLRLRPPAPADAVWIAELANDVDVARMTTSIRHPYGLRDAEGFLAAMASADPREDRPLMIEHPEFGPIGMTGFHRHAATGTMELGYWLGRTFRGRGFATEAVTAALGWAQRGLDERGWGKRAVTSSHFADNAVSARVLDKAGFLYTGAVERRFSLGRGREVETRMMVRVA